MKNFQIFQTNGSIAAQNAPHKPPAFAENGVSKCKVSEVAQQLFWGDLQGKPKPLAARPCARGAEPLRNSARQRGEKREGIEAAWPRRRREQRRLGSREPRFAEANAQLGLLEHGTPIDAETTSSNIH